MVSVGLKTPPAELGVSIEHGGGEAAAAAAASAAAEVSTVKFAGGVKGMNAVDTAATAAATSAAAAGSAGSAAATAPAFAPTPSPGSSPGHTGTSQESTRVGRRRRVGQVSCQALPRE